MAPARDNSIPQTRGQALRILRSVDDNINRLTVEQRKQLRVLYRLDDNHSVAEICRSEGRLL